MRNIKLIIEYDGTGFYGWQRQSEERTVQGVLEDAVRAVFALSSGVVGAGRTDTGVHALDYPCNFLIDSDLPTTRIVAALTAHLPGDIVVKNAQDVHESFHARFDALSRRYIYRISRVRTALWRHMYHTPRYRLDAGAMATAVACLRGEHDFTSFTPTINNVNPVCDVMEIDVDEGDDLITITIEANRFLHNMVRVIVGTMVEVGRGFIPVEHMESILCKKDRREAGPTAPANGLALVLVRYPDDPGAQARLGTVPGDGDVL
jgi:tRNA pseudouridine38-40 synthase